MKARARLLLAFFCFLFAGWGSTGHTGDSLVPLETFVSLADESQDPRISPDGTFVSFFRETSGERAIVISRTEDLSTPIFLFADPGHCIDKVSWVGGEKWLAFQASPNCKVRDSHRPQPGYVVFAWQIADDTLIRVTEPSSFRYGIRTSHDRPDVLAVLRDKRDPKATTFEVINLSGGERRAVDTPEGTTSIYLDRLLRPRLITQRTDGGGFDLRRRGNAGDWHLVGHYENAERDGFRVLSFSASGHLATLIDTRDRPHAAVTQINLATGVESVLYEHERWQPVDALLNPTGTDLHAAQYHGDRKRWAVLDQTFGSVFEQFRLFYPAEISIISKSGDGNSWILAIDRDNGPRHHYLYDIRRQVLQAFPDNDAVAEHTFSNKTPIAFRARDGVPLTGYITLPESTPEQAFPLVQRVHGGPVLRHEWRFDPTTQWLANRGYAVLEVNFRGSGGFGASFQRQGYGEWGGKMQDDLADGVVWAVEQGFALADKIGIMGHSYGGYATAMGLIRYPELYRCGIAVSGPLDLPLFVDTLQSYGTLAKTASQRAFVSSQIARYRTELGVGIVDLRRISPYDVADQIKAPLLLVHGKRDRGVVFAHSQRVFEMLEKRSHPAALLEFDNEGHEIARPQNQMQMMSVAEQFFASCLGGKAERDGQPATSPNGHLSMTPEFARILRSSAAER